MLEIHKLAVNLFLLAAIVAPSLDAVAINEILIEPDGPNDVQQFFELQGAPGESLAGLAFIVVSGEESFAGDVDLVIDLGALALGSNGLLLFRDDPAVLIPPPSPQTTVVIADQSAPIFPLFFANESQTFLLVSGFTGAVLDDLDTNDDGVLDLFPWTSVVDAVGIRENDSTPANEFAYGAQVGFFDFAVTGFDPDSIWRDRVTREWYASDVSNSTDQGPYFFVDHEFVDMALNDQNPASFDRPGLTPGALNAAQVPEPSTWSMLILAGGALALLRRRKS